jgi:hypothetical protein
LNFAGSHVAGAASKEADVIPGPDLWQQTQTRGSESAHPDVEFSRAEALVSLGQAQRLLIGALRSQEQGMTVRQLEAKLSWPSDDVQQVLDGLLESRVIGRLNTIIPSYVWSGRRA